MYRYLRPHTFKTAGYFQYVTAVPTYEQKVDATGKEDEAQKFSNISTVSELNICQEKLSIIFLLLPTLPYA